MTQHTEATAPSESQTWSAGEQANGMHDPAFHAENLLVHYRRVEQLKREARAFPSIDLSPGQLCDLEHLLARAYYPLLGYHNRQDYESIIDTGRTVDGALWPIPIVLDVPEKIAKGIASGGALMLRDSEGFPLAVLRIGDIWQPDLEREAEALFGTNDANTHPGVRRFFEETNPWYVGGRLEGLHLPQHHDFLELRNTPPETYRMFSQRGWRQVIGVLTDKYPHCAHRESYLNAARETGASILLQTMVADPLPREAEHFTRVHCVKHFVRSFPRTVIHHCLLPWKLREAGPREAVLRAIVQRNYGCTHVLIRDDEYDPFAAANGSDPTRFYPRGEAQRQVESVSDELGLQVVPLKRMAYVASQERYLPETEVAGSEDVMLISSAELRRRLEFGLDIPDWFSLPEIVAEMRKAFPPRHRQGFTILLTGLSGAGKSTLAKALYVRFMEARDRPVTLLDGDIVRRNLSSELTFSREHRELNVQRIGFVASEITKNRGIAICAPIAPYANSRQACRELISKYGGYVEVHMATPLEVCERRDRKGIYAKARAGIMKGVTGIDDPYETPENPEIHIDTSKLTPNEAAQQVLLYLEEQGYLRFTA